MNYCWENQMCWFIILLLLNAHTFAADYTGQDSFFLQQQRELIEEYRVCTGDTVTSEIDSILRWKNVINLRTDMPEYQKILKEFIQHTGLVKDALPCQVLNWHLARLKFLRLQEDSIQNVLLKKADYTVDSFRVAFELQQNPASKFDFMDIPFGLSKKVFMHIFREKISYPITDAKRYMLIEHFSISDKKFMIKFYFNRHNRFYKYEIEGYGFSGNDLNDIVRPQAALLRELLDRKIGPPDRIYRVGYFDIKSGILTPYAKWEREDYSAVVGYSIYKHYFFTRETVICKKLMDARRRYR